MNHLAEAKRLAHSADSVDISVDWAQVYAQLAIAHVGIAMVERMDKTTEDADLEMERKERWQEYQARREMEAVL